MLAETEVQALLEGRHRDPFAALGLHEGVDGRLWLRALLPGASSVVAIDSSGREILELVLRHADGLFEAKVPRRRKRFGYRLRVHWGEGLLQELDDAYAFGPQLPASELKGFRDGSHPRPYLLLGAHPLTVDGVAGVRFAVWAPNARRASVVGDFNAWDGRRLPMRLRHEGGVWEIFVPGVCAGALYKYELVDAGGSLLPLKADPYAFAAELRPANASIVAAVPARKSLPPGRAAANRRDAPIAIYEVHAPSWRREGAGFPDWEFLAHTLPAYAAGLGFTHVELLPVSEHPFAGS
ncbi:MAG: 1,4-alpha-glucan branching enzyme, partial [Arenimonas sp.]